MAGVPPRGQGRLARLEQRLAWLMLLSTFLIVLVIVLLPLAADFWIGFEPIGLADLRSSEATAAEQVRGDELAAGETTVVIYTVRNSSPSLAVLDVSFTDAIAPGVTLALPADAPCTVVEGTFACERGELDPVPGSASPSRPPPPAICRTSRRYWRRRSP